MSIASEITRLQNAKADIKTAIEAKGVEIPSNATLDEYSDYVEEIPSGGTDTRWQEIGYDKEPKAIQDGIDYAKQIMQNWDASVTDRSNAFNSDYNLVYFPEVNFSNVINSKYMFREAYALQSIPADLLNQENSNLDDAGYMFYYCHSLKEVGDIKNGNKKHDMFLLCTGLKKVKSITILSRINNDSIFEGCTSLQTIEEINTTLTSFDNNTYNHMFDRCPNLSNATLKVILNFLKQLINQSSTRKTLHTFGLSQTQAELCTTFDEWTDLANAGWTTGY